MYHLLVMKVLVALGISKSRKSINKKKKKRKKNNRTKVAQTRDKVRNLEEMSYSSRIKGSFKERYKL